MSSSRNIFMEFSKGRMFRFYLGSKEILELYSIVWDILAAVNMSLIRTFWFLFCFFPIWDFPVLLSVSVYTFLWISHIIRSQFQKVLLWSMECARNFSLLDWTWKWNLWVIQNIDFHQVIFHSSHQSSKYPTSFLRELIGSNVYTLYHYLTGLLIKVSYFLKDVFFILETCQNWRNIKQFFPYWSLCLIVLRWEPEMMFCRIVRDCGLQQNMQWKNDVTEV